MATRTQTQAARRNVRKAQRAARSQRRISHMPKSTSRALGQQAARGRARDGSAIGALEDRNREQLYKDAKRMNIHGRSKMSKWDLIQAIRRAR